MTNCSLLKSFLRLQTLPRICYPCRLKKLGVLDKVFLVRKIILPAMPIHNFKENINFRTYSSTSATDITKAEKEIQKGNKKPKTTEISKIVLLSETGSVSIVTIEEANKMAKKKSLKIREVSNPSGIMKTDKKVFQLISNTQLLDEDKSHRPADEEKEKPKDVKTVILKSTTSDNDIISKVKNVKKWIEKGHTVRVFIGKVGEKGNGEHVYDVFQDNLKDVSARIVQKVVKGSEIRFQVMPPKEPNKKVKKEIIEREREENT